MIRFIDKIINKGLITSKIIDKVVNNSIIVKPTEKLNIVKDDPDDNKIIECAVEGSADYIISQDNHLLNLKEYKGIKIIKPEEFLSLISNN